MNVYKKQLQLLKNICYKTLQSLNEEQNVQASRKRDEQDDTTKPRSSGKLATKT